MRKEVEKYFNKLHPEYTSLSEKEQWSSHYVMDEKIMHDNINEIHEKYHSLYEDGKQPEEIMPLIMSHFRAKAYFNKLHPEYAKLSEKEQLSSHYVMDEKVIRDNIKEIHEKYHSLYEDGKQPEEIMPLIMSHFRAKAYFNKLHPEYAKLSEKEQLSSHYVMDEKVIQDNIKQIHEKYHSLYEDGKQPEEIMPLIMSHFRAKAYFNKLHPEYASLSEKEQWSSHYAIDEKLIQDNIKEIHEKYHSLYEDGKQPDEIMPLIMSYLREQKLIKEEKSNTFIDELKEQVVVDVGEYTNTTDSMENRKKSVPENDKKEIF